MVKGQSGLGHFLDIGHGSEFGSVVLEVMDGIILGNEEDDARPLGPKRGNSEEKNKRNSHDGARLIGKNYCADDGVKGTVSTKIKAVVSDDWRSGELIVELVLANDLITFTGFEHGKGTVPGSQKIRPLAATGEPR